ncbi:MAG: hypothetical protein IT378_12985 [Sandaracinaceae bacterium]|nr:hypothetical protein [Sandaracinaceae bacterium]
MRGALLRCVVVPVGALLVAGASCGQPQTATPAPSDEVQAPALGRPDLRLLVLTDLKGYLEPCGCTSHPLGGIDRLAAQVAALRGEAPSVLLAAGDLFFTGEARAVGGPDAAAQEIWKAEVVADVLSRLQLAAAAPGPLDFSEGRERLVALAERARFPLLAAGVRGESHLVPSRIVRAGELSVGVVGASALAAPDGALPPGLEADPLRDAVQRAVREVRGQGAQVVVVLARADRRSARQLAGLAGVDFVVQGGLDEAEAQAPATTGQGVLLHAGRQGQGLLVVDLYRRGEGEWIDASVWTRTELRAHVRERARALAQRIAEWERDPGVEPADLATQRSRLEGLRREEAGLARAPSLDGNVLSARWIPLGPDAPSDAEVAALVDAYDRRVNEHNRNVFANLAPIPAPEGAPRYVGSQACASCHGGAMRWWRGHPHGTAYATLERQHKNYNLSCVGCHVTGYMRPGGSNVTHVENLQNVGCESCHGPGSAHVQDSTVDVVRDPAEAACASCHTPEHSDHFHYPTYRQMLIAPGHGLPPT